MATTAELQVLLKAKDDASAVLKKMSAELGTLGNATKAPQSGFNSLFATIGKAAAVVGGLALVAKAASGIGDAVGSAVSSAVGFEKSMSAIKAVSGATGQQMAQLSKLALDLGRDTSFSASEAASGIEELVKGGVSIADIYGGAASAALSLAAAGGVSLGEAATIAANAMNQFGLQGSDMENVANKVAGAANASSISVSDFNLSLSAVGAVAHLAGQSFDSTATAIALLGQQGIKGSDAGTSLKAVLNNLIPTTDTATAKMRELGLITASGANQFVDSQGKMKGFGDIAQILQKQTAGLTESQRLLALELIFGSDGMRAAGILATQGGQGFDTLAGSMDKVTAAAVAAERLNNLAGDIEQLKGSVETAGITVASVFLPALRGIAQGTTAMVNNFTQEAATLIQTAKNIASKDGVGMIDASIIAVSLRIKEVFGEGAQSTFNTFIEGVKRVGTAFDEVKTKAGTLKEQLNITFDSTQSRKGAGDFVAMMGDMGTAVDTAHKKFNEWVFDHIKGLKVSQEAQDEFSGKTKTGWDKIVEFAGEMQKGVQKKLDEFAADVHELPGKVEEDAGQTGLQLVNGIAQGMDPKVVATAMTVMTLEAIGTASATAAASAPEAGAALGAAMADGVTAEALDTAASAAVTEAAGTAASLAAQAAPAVGAALDVGMAAGVTPDAITAATTGAVTTATSAAQGTASAQSPSIGANIVQGIVNGINLGRGGVIGAAISLATAAIGAAQAKLKEGSPSKVFEEIGANVDLGFIDGIDGMTSDVETAIGDLMTGAGEAATTAAVDAFANLATALGAQFEKTFTIVEAAQNAIDNARADLDRKFQRDTELEEIKFQRRLQDLREEAGRASVKDRKDVLQKIEQLQEDHGRKIIDAQQANLDRIAELEFDAADKIAQAQEKQALVRGAALRDFQRDTDELLRDTANKAAEIGKKASNAISDAMRDAGQSIVDARDKAEEAVTSLLANQLDSRALREKRDKFGGEQDAAARDRDQLQENADLEYNLTRDLEKAKLKLGKDKNKAATEDDRRQLDIQYADEVQNLRDGFNEAKRDLARRRAIADDNDAFRKGQQKALQAFNDSLEDDALKKQIRRLQDERDARIKEIGTALDDKLVKIKQSESDEREALAKSAAEKLDDLKTKFYDKVGALNDESKGAFQSLFDSIAAGVRAAAGAVADLSTAINNVSNMKTPNATGGGGGGGTGMKAADGQTFAGQGVDVQSMFLSEFGTRAAAEEAWIAQHNYEIDAGNLGKAPRTVNGVDMGPYNGEAGQSWFSTPEESGSNASDHFAGGGVVGGGMGAARLVTAHGGEGVFTPEQMAALPGMYGGGNITIVAEIDGQRFAYGTAPYLRGELDRMVRLKLG